MEIILLDVSNFSISSFVIKIVVNTVALLLAAMVLSGVQLKGIKTAFAVALLVALLNATLGSYLTERTGWEVGFLSFIIDGIVLMVASWFLKDFKIKGVLWALFLALALALLNGILFKII